MKFSEFLNEAKSNEVEYKMDKFMPEDLSVQNEFYKLLDAKDHQVH